MNKPYKSLLTSSKIIILASFLGPVSVLITQMIHPMPIWSGADQFIEHYHKSHSISIFFGFLLLYGFVRFIAASFSLREKINMDSLVAALIFTSIYAAFTGFNYVVNTSYIPHVFDEFKEATTIFSMSNPKSLCWSLEMYGYGFLGLASLLIAPNFKEYSSIFLLLRINGYISILGAALTFFSLSWVLSTLGMVFYIGWNVLIITIMLLVIIKFEKKRK